MSSLRHGCKIDAVGKGNEWQNFNEAHEARWILPEIIYLFLILIINERKSNDFFKSGRWSKFFNELDLATEKTFHRYLFSIYSVRNAKKKLVLCLYGILL